MNKLKSIFSSVKAKLSALPKWLKRLIVIILIIGIIGTIVFVKRSGQSVVPVQIGSVTQQDLNRTVVTSGRLKAVDEQEFFTPEDSTLMELNVKLGDRVKKGDVLGRLDTLELARLYQNAVATLASKKAELARAEAQDDGLILKNAEAAYIKAKNHLDRVNSLYEAGAITAEEVESARAEYASTYQTYQEALTKVKENAYSLERSSLRAQCDLAEQEVAQAKERMEMGTFTAREDGVVIEVDAIEGSKVAEDTKIMVVGIDTQLEVTANVNEIDAGDIKVGQPVTINCMSLPGRQYRGEVSRVGSAAIVQNSSSGEVVNVPITVRLLKNEPDLKIGYTVDMTINTMQMSKVLTIPVEALADRGGKTVVYVMKNNVLQEREVKTKSGNELFDVVVSGLKAGEQVVLSPAQTLKNGQKVIVAPAGIKP